MGLFVLLKKISFLFLLILAAFVASSSFAAGRPFGSVELKVDNEKTTKDLGYLELIRQDDGEVMSEIHKRVLKMNSYDYGRYDPTPARRKPSFKLIPH